MVAHRLAGSPVATGFYHLFPRHLELSGRHLMGASSEPRKPQYNAAFGQQWHRLVRRVFRPHGAGVARSAGIDGRLFGAFMVRARFRGAAKLVRCHASSPHRGSGFGAPAVFYPAVLSVRPVSKKICR